MCCRGAPDVSNDTKIIFVQSLSEILSKFGNLCADNQEFMMPIKNYNKHFKVCKKKNISPSPISSLSLAPEEEKCQKFEHPYPMNGYCKLIKIYCVAFTRWWAAVMKDFVLSRSGCEAIIMHT